MDCEMCWNKWANCGCSIEARKYHKKYKILLEALNEIVGSYGPGIDGSPEEIAGKLAREAIEEAEND